MSPSDFELVMRVLERRLEATTNPVSRYRVRMELDRTAEALKRARADASWAQQQREVKASWREMYAATRAEEEAWGRTQQRRAAQGTTT